MHTVFSIYCDYIGFFILHGVIVCSQRSNNVFSSFYNILSYPGRSRRFLTGNSTIEAQNNTFLIVYSLLTFVSGEVIVLIFFFAGVTFSLVAFIFLVSLWFSFSEKGTCFMVCALLLRHVKQMPINEKMSMSKYISDLCPYKPEDTIHFHLS